MREANTGVESAESVDVDAGAFFDGPAGVPGIGYAFGGACGPVVSLVVDDVRVCCVDFGGEGDWDWLVARLGW